MFIGNDVLTVRLAELCAKIPINIFFFIRIIIVCDSLLILYVLFVIIL